MVVSASMELVYVALWLVLSIALIYFIQQKTGY